MRILIIGSGGREHALAWKIKQSPHVDELYCAPGNPGIAALAECIPIAGGDMKGLLRFAEERRIDLIVVGPEQPLADGIADLFEERGLKIFGPTKRAAELEWSKAFAKAFMARHGVPTAGYQTFASMEREGAVEALKSSRYPVVLKADGLAAGKGVVICNDRAEGLAALGEMMNGKAFGSAGSTIVIEEFMTGEEASLFAICGGLDYAMLAPAQDHKRIFDNDQGKNTGGMGAYAPAPIVTRDVLELTKKNIIGPVLRGMASEGRPYKGCLYIGLMLTTEGPKVVEFNSRLGDPETQVVLPLYTGDIVELMLAACEGRIGGMNPADSTGSAVCVVMASAGYPDKYPTGKEIHGLNNLPDGIVAFHAGTTTVGGRVVTAGGRVLGVTAISHASDMEKTIQAAYDGVARIRFDGAQYRHDIGKKALARASEIAL